LGLEEYNENFIDNGFDNIEYTLLQTSFKEMPFDEFLVRDELRIDDDITINTILKRLRQSKFFLEFFLIKKNSLSSWKFNE